MEIIIIISIDVIVILEQTVFELSPEKRYKTVVFSLTSKLVLYLLPFESSEPIKKIAFSN